MLRLILRIVLVGIVAAVILWMHGSISNKRTLSPLSHTSISTTQKAVTTTKSTIIVPYWTLNQKIDVASFDAVMYFGVNAGTKGLVVTDEGYNDIDSFIAAVPHDKKKYLVLDMVNTDVNNQVLQNKDVQNQIARQIASLAKTKGFDGVVMDFEISAIGFQSVVTNISQLIATVSKEVRAQHLIFATLLYGDAFYRARPYDVSAIGTMSDSVYVMAYDFHKANGNPGPNFPYSGTKENYNFQTMITDFLTYIPAPKLSIVFGMYGYDWAINEKGDAIKKGVSLSDNEIITKILGHCAVLHCQKSRDEVSQETEIIYTDSDKQQHVVWFEDMISVEKKKTFLMSKGISSINFWAYSYF